MEIDFIITNSAQNSIYETWSGNKNIIQSPQPAPYSMPESNWIGFLKLLILMSVKFVIFQEIGPIAFSG